MAIFRTPEPQSNHDLRIDFTAPRTPSVPLALGPIRWLNLSKAGALLLIIYLSAGNLNEIVIVIVL